MSRQRKTLAELYAMKSGYTRSVVVSPAPTSSVTRCAYCGDDSHGKTFCSRTCQIADVCSDFAKARVRRSRKAAGLRKYWNPSEPSLNRSEITAGIPTGYADIDKLTAGWQAGDYNILAARPSAGKTALAIEFSLRQARAGNAVTFFSLEMSRASIYPRMVCREAGVNSQLLRCDRLSASDLKKLLAAVAHVDALPLWIDDSCSLRASDLRWRLRSLCKRHGIKFAVVDYLQLLRSPGKDRFESVTNSSIELKAASKEIGQLTGGTLLALSQLNRAGAGERPRLEHLRESGQLEQDGDVVFLLSDAEPVGNGQVQPCKKILEIAKQRNGPCEDIAFTFLPAVGGFEQWASGDVWDYKSAAAHDET